MVYFYKKKLPKVGDLVVSDISSIMPMCGYICNLLEYDDKTAFVPLRDISTFKVKKLEGIINEGDVEIMYVSSIEETERDIEINLSRKYINEQDRIDIMNRYNTFNSVYKLIEHSCKDLIGFESIQDLFYIWQETSLPMEQKETTNSESVLDYYVPIRQWLFTMELSDDELEIFKKICDIVDKIPVPKIHSKVISINCTLKLRSVYAINYALSRISRDFNVLLYSCNTKQGEYTVKTIEKVSIDQFQELCTGISNFYFDSDDYISVKPLKPSQDINQYTSSSKPLLNIGIIGHVSHGKTTLIEALTGVDTRRHKKEVATNRTLNIGYTNLSIVKCNCRHRMDDQERVCLEEFLLEKDKFPDCNCLVLTASIVDCPGHSVLLTTMITGANVFDTCIVVSAANEKCPQPQTEEHVKIVEIVSKCTHNVIIHNKCDLINKNTALESRIELSNFLDDTMFQNSSIIPVSAQYKLGIEFLLKHLYSIMEKKYNQISRVFMSDKIGSKCLVLRSFDINKPGTRELKGLVVGGSILDGNFNIGDEIVFLPSRLETFIFSIKTDNIDLQSGSSGGLLAFGTDLNPVHCNELVTQIFIKKSEFIKENLLFKGHKFEVKYYLYEKKSLKVNDVLSINYLGRNTDCIVFEKNISKKNHVILQLSNSLYVFPDEYFYCLLFKNGSLIGYCRSIQYGSGRKPNNVSCKSFIDHSYEDLLDKFHDQLKNVKENIAKQKLSIPVPNLIYKHTFTTIYNFPTYSERFNVNSQHLANFVFTELGSKSFSLSNEGHLILKGRTTENQLLSIFNSFIKDNKCLKCKVYTTNIIVVLGVKRKLCSDCC
jgi:small GTP-binding protein